MLRERLAAALGVHVDLHVPSPRLATDNAAMVARLAEHRLAEGHVSDLDLNADPSLPFPGLEQPAAPAGTERGRAIAGSERSACTPT